MDQELTAQLAELKVQKPSGTRSQPLELAATFFRREGQLYVRLTGPKGRSIEHRLKALQDLYSPGRSAAEVSWSDEVHLPLLSSIEGAIASFYREHPELTDGQVLLVLEGLIRRLEPEEADPLRTRIQDHLRLQLSLDKWSRQEVLGCLKKVRKSVELHKSDSELICSLEKVGRGPLAPNGNGALQGRGPVLPAGSPAEDPATAGTCHR